MRASGVGRDEVLKQCSKTRHPSSLPLMGARRAWVSAPPAPWCHALVAMGLVSHHKAIEINSRNKLLAYIPMFVIDRESTLVEEPTMTKVIINGLVILFVGKYGLITFHHAFDVDIVCVISL